MVQQRNASAHTVRSYRDTWRLFLRFVAQRHNRTVAQLGLADLTGSEVRSFPAIHRAGTRRHHRHTQLPSGRAAQLLWLRRRPRADGHRAVHRDPAHSDQEGAVARAVLSGTGGGEGHSGATGSLDPRRPARSRAALLPLQHRRAHPGSARCSPARRSGWIRPLVCVSTARVARSVSARCGRKRCRCSRRCCDGSRGLTTNRLFVNRYGAPLGASGVRFKLAQYVEAAAKNAPSLASKHVTPHSFRHATAVHLVAAGVDITVIRSWLGHVSLDTTNHYAQANLETKRKALERLETSSRPSKPPPWKRDKSVLAWLDTL